MKQYQRLQRAYREVRAEADDLRGEKDAAAAAQRLVFSNGTYIHYLWGIY